MSAGPHGSIEIVKCAIFRSYCHRLARELTNLRDSRVEFQEIGDRLGFCLSAL